ncbi:lysophospholipid acyltransferase family protein [Nocardioides sp.]|uniref:lysophospholipid acyltransferase family protein n=1 Tax=Nocardioides sp. TaxID=35761 RepID=UPI003D0C53F8
MNHAHPPRTIDVPPIRERTLQLLRPSVRAVMGRRWDVRLHGLEQVPAGPHIVASNHLGLMDGPLLAAYHPHAVHALTKQEMFHGVPGLVLRAAGQVSLDRWSADPGAIKACIRILRDGGVVGVYPEGGRGAGEFTQIRAGAAYLALVTGAPVVPLAVFGTRDPGGDTNSRPRRGAPIDFVYGAPVRIEPVAFPRTQEQIRRSTVFLHEALCAHLDAARALTGRELPGPLPTESPSATASTKEHIDD